MVGRGNEMKISREKAIKVLDYITSNVDWVECMDDLGLYNVEEDTWPSFYEVMEELGVSKSEVSG